MRPTIPLLALAAAAALLSACNQGGGEKGKEAAVTPSALTAPQRKAGLWEQSTNGEGMPSMTMSICLGPDTDKGLADFAGQSGAQCGAGSYTKISDGMTFSNTCALPGGGETKTEGKITGDFNSEYSMEYHSETTGSAAAQMNGTHAMTIHAIWKGECPADMKAGDVKTSSVELKLPNGQTIKMPSGMTVKMPSAPK